MFCCLLLAVAFLFHTKVLYQAYQKRLRFNEYNEMVDLFYSYIWLSFSYPHLIFQINEMTHSLKVIENVGNKTDSMLRVLKESMKKKSKRPVLTQAKYV